MISRTIARVYYKAWSGLSKADRTAWALFTGFWLGVLSRSSLDAIDDLYYIGSSGRQLGPLDYRAEEYNRSGLWDWEGEAIDRFFTAPSRIAVLGAGGGREVLALRRRRFDVVGWECQRDFVDSANRLLESEGFEVAVRWAPRDEIPGGDEMFDGFIVGWGTYTLIPGRSRRVALLRQIRRRVCDGAPILLSFFARGRGDRRFQLASSFANVGRRLLFREPSEVGDYLNPNYGHFFTEDEVRGELEDAGFELAEYRAKPYGHAIGLAIPGCT